MILVRNTFSILFLLVYLFACNSEAPISTPKKIKSDVPEGMVLIPAGEFIMGSDDIDASGKSKEFGFNEPWYVPEHPKRTVFLPAYYIDKFEVTNGQYVKWLKASGRYSEQQLQAIYKKLKVSEENKPVRAVSWARSQDYCYGVGKHLPSEAQWEKAARGTTGQEYPWGEKWQADYLNAGQNEQNIMPVGSYEKGKSPYGVYDMAGNVMEWTADWYQAYPGSEYKSPQFGRKRKVVRGGSWGGIGHYVIPHYFRTAYRFNFPPDDAYNDVGFRCVKEIDE